MKTLAQVTVLLITPLCLAACPFPFGCRVNTKGVSATPNQVQPTQQLVVDDPSQDCNDRPVRMAMEFHPPKGLIEPVAYLEIERPNNTLTSVPQTTDGYFRPMLKLNEGQNPVTIRYYNNNMRLLGSQGFNIDVRINRPACTNFAKERR